MKRALLLVLDGLGVGAMKDVADSRPQDLNANTLARVLDIKKDLAIPTLTKLGLLRSLNRVVENDRTAIASWGWCQLGYHGADSYLGHQEIMGTVPADPQKTLLKDVADHLKGLLESHGHTVTKPLPGKPLLLINNTIVVGDNLEADSGQNINLTVCTDLIDFAKAVEIGQIVREAVKVARVIVFGGPGLTLDKIFANVEERESGQVGIISPALGVYNENLLVKHMGYGVDPTLQSASIFESAGFEVYLDGKMADLIECETAIRDSVVATTPLLSLIESQFKTMQSGLIAATVQETDLAAHGFDTHRICMILEEVDRFLTNFLPLMNQEDMLIITADHGNDPGLGTGLHSRETTPLLVYSSGFAVTPLGNRNCLADMSASLVDHFNLSQTQDGKSFIPEMTKLI
jgi:phosphopentomutase